MLLADRNPVDENSYAPVGARLGVTSRSAPTWFRCSDRVWRSFTRQSSRENTLVVGFSSGCRPTCPGSKPYWSRSTAPTPSAESGETRVRQGSPIPSEKPEGGSRRNSVSAAMNRCSRSRISGPPMLAAYTCLA